MANGSNELNILRSQFFEEDASVGLALQQQTEPVSLEQCLHAFTREEQLSGDEKYYCPKCATHGTVASLFYAYVFVTPSHSQP